jgi:hypothetical protein
LDVSDDCANDWMKVIRQRDWQLLKELTLEHCKISDRKIRITKNEKCL